MGFPVRCKLFAGLRSALGTKEIELIFPEKPTVEKVLNELKLDVNASYILLRNGLHVGKDAILEANDTLSIFPLVAGG